MTSEEKCFTFVWKLENACYCVQKYGEEIISPAFVVDAIESTKWRLVLYPRGHEDAKFKNNSIFYYLRRETDSKGNIDVQIKFELTFIGIDGSNPTNSIVHKRIFTKGIDQGVQIGIADVELLVIMRCVFMPNDTLTFRCRIWKSEGEMTEDVKCTALTRIGVEKRTLKWDVKNFSSLELEKKLNLHIKSVQNDSSLMSVDLSLIRGSDSEIVQFELSLQDKTIKFVTLKLFLINNSRKRVICNQEEMWFDHPTSKKQLAFTFTKKDLLERKNVYLPNDTLSLVLEWVFSKGTVSEETVEDIYGSICSEIKFSDAQNSCDHQNSLLNDFVDNMKCLYDERYLSDVKLMTATSEFLAHKFTLSESSPVFKTMFSCDMKEKITNCIQIEDLDDDTVNRMLIFIYTTRVRDLTFKNAKNLYAAADKYAIISLKKICSSFLKKNVSINNACDVLLLADLHADVELKSEVQDYIITKGQQITQSDEWKALMIVNPTLAAETLSQLFK